MLTFALFHTVFHFWRSGSSDHPMGRSLFQISTTRACARATSLWEAVAWLSGRMLSSCLALSKCLTMFNVYPKVADFHGISWDQWCQPTWFFWGGSPLWQWATDDQLLNLWIYPGSSCQMAEFIAPMSSAHGEEWKLKALYGHGKSRTSWYIAGKKNYKWWTFQLAMFDHVWWHWGVIFRSFQVLIFFSFVNWLRQASFTPFHADRGKFQAPHCTGLGT